MTLKGRALFTKEQYEQICQEYKNGYSGPELGTKWKCDDTTIYEILQRHGVPRKYRTKAPHKPKKFSEETLEKLRGPNSVHWKGGISFEEYCPLFNEAFKERVRKFFSYTCPNCGKTQEENGKKLSVHHVTYNKKMCCDDDEEMGVPHLFIPLCNSCHSKSNFNREEWEELFYYMIIFEYNGQCFTNNKYK